MGRALDLSREQIARLEGGTNKPRPSTRGQVAETFGLPAEKLTADALSGEALPDLLTIAKLHLEAQRAAASRPGGLGQFHHFVVWFRAMSVSDQSLTLAALQKIHDEARAAAALPPKTISTR